MAINSKQDYDEGNRKLYQLQQMAIAHQLISNQGLQNAYQSALAKPIDDSNEILLLIEEGI